MYVMFWKIISSVVSSGKLIRLTAEISQLIEYAEIRAYHLQLRLDLQLCALAGRFNDIVTAARHGEIHIFAIAHFNVNPVHAGRFQLPHLFAQHRVVRPE